MDKKTLQTVVLVAIGLVALLLAWTYYRSRRRVLDPSNDTALSRLFDLMNPDIAGTVGPGV